MLILDGGTPAPTAWQCRRSFGGRHRRIDGVLQLQEHLAIARSKLAYRKGSLGRENPAMNLTRSMQLPTSPSPHPSSTASTMFAPVPAPDTRRVAANLVRGRRQGVAPWPRHHRGAGRKNLGRMLLSAFRRDVIASPIHQSDRRRGIQYKPSDDPRAFPSIPAVSRPPPPQSR